MSEDQIARILSRLDRLEASLTERHVSYQRQQDAIDGQLASLDERIRAVEITQAKLLAIVTGGATIGGTIGGILVVVSRAMRVF